MKLEVGLLNVLTVADSSYALRILRWVGMRHPADGVRQVEMSKSSVLSGILQAQQRFDLPFLNNLKESYGHS